MKKYAIVVLFVGILIGISLAALSGVVMADDPNPPPINVEQYAFPPDPLPTAGQPVDCAGLAYCGVMCFVLRGDNGDMDLSCVSWDFKPWEGHESELQHLPAVNSQGQ